MGREVGWSCSCHCVLGDWAAGVGSLVTAFPASELVLEIKNRGLEKFRSWECCGQASSGGSLPHRV